MCRNIGRCWQLLAFWLFLSLAGTSWAQETLPTLTPNDLLKLSTLLQRYEQTTKNLENNLALSQANLTILGQKLADSEASSATLSKQLVVSQGQLQALKETQATLTQSIETSVASWKTYANAEASKATFWKTLAIVAGVLCAGSAGALVFTTVF